MLQSSVLLGFGLSAGQPTAGEFRRLMYVSGVSVGNAPLPQVGEASSAGNRWEWGCDRNDQQDKLLPSENAAWEKFSVESVGADGL